MSVFFEKLRKGLQENPFIFKSAIAHILFVIFLFILAKISNLDFNSDIKIQAQVKNKNSDVPQVIEATSISNSELNNQIQAYEKHQQAIKQAQEDIKRAREAAIKKVEQERLAKIAAEKKAREDAKRKAEEEAEEEARKKAEAEKQAKLEAQRKAEAAKQAKLEAERKAKEEEAKKKAEAEEKAREEAKRKAQEDAKKQIEAERKARQEAKRKAEEDARKQMEAERKAQQEARDKARKEAEAAAQKQLEENQANAAVNGYVSEYAARIGENLIKDDCRGIYELPKAIIKNGQFVKLTGTSGNFACDQSLVAAVKATTPPTITNSIAKQIIAKEGISFEFEQI